VNEVLENPVELDVAALLFDLDGTLVDSSQSFALAMNQSLEKFGQLPMPTQEMAQMISAGARGIIRHAWSSPITFDQVEEVREDFVQRYEGIAVDGAYVYGQLLDVLNTAKSTGIKVGIVTNKPEVLAKPVLNGLSLSPLVDVLICPDHVSEIKPNPEGILLACEHLQVTPAQAVYVGDHLKDVQAAQRAGCLAIACGYGFKPDDEDSRQWGAQLHAQTPEDLEHILLDLIK